jgi:hypothetical protein
VRWTEGVAIANVGGDAVTWWVALYVPSSRPKSRSLWGEFTPENIRQFTYTAARRSISQRPACRRHDESSRRVREVHALEATRFEQAADFLGGVERVHALREVRDPLVLP